jgi:methyl-accepting chemotaxis protein
MFRKLRNLKIGAQIIVASFLLVVLAVACTSVTSIRYFSRYMQKSAGDEAQYSISGFEKTIADEMTITKNFRDQLTASTEFARILSQKDGEALYNFSKPLMEASKIDILVIADSDGVVLARPHDKDRVGDSIAGNADVQNALSGNTYEMFMTAASTKLGYYCGAPIKYDGEIVGMVRTALSLEDTNLVDNVKALFGTEATIFADKTRINTSIINGGKRVVGTDASPAVVDEVLQKGNDFVGEVTIFGEKYLAHYTPIKDPSNSKIAGMLFTGKSLTEMNTAIRSTIISVAAVSLVILLVAFIVSFWTARRISKPLARIVQLSERGSDGDLTITREDFDYNGGGELKTLVDSFSDMISSQRTTLSQVMDTSDSVTEHTKELASLSQENNTTMTQTKSLIGEVSSLCDANTEAVERGTMGISEMAQGANSVAKMSVDSADSLAKTTKISREAVQSVDSLVNSIGMVDTKTMENQKKIRELSNSVSEISNFMNVIASIADQTNLLALNAAIEAARAGDAGRGFAVVAEEVRKLAEESRNASKSVEELVSTLSRNAGDAISATEDSVDIVKEIMSMANVTVTGLNGALGEITSANEAIQSIAAVAQEQAAASSEITNAIEAINKSTGLISQKMSELNDLSNQAASIGSSVSVSADEMSQSAEEMRDALSHFKMSSQKALKA